MERAIHSNLDLQIARARVREARAQYRITAADTWPTVETTGACARQNQSKHQPLLGAMPLPASVPFENDVYQAGFDASWEVDVFGGTRRAVEAGKAEADKGRGVITDAAVHARVLAELNDFVATQTGLCWRGVVESPLLGPAGNKEFLTLIEKVR